jgi:hypothetical protein
MQSYDKLVEKWAPVLNEESAGKITDYHRRSVTAAILENQEIALREEANANAGFLSEAAPAANTTSAANWNPVLISLVRRAMPNLMAYDVCGVQPMSGPTGLIFAMKSRYTNNSGAEALFNEANTKFSGTQVTAAQPADGAGLSAANMDSDSTADDARVTYLAAAGLTTDSGEALGDGVGGAIANMGFTIEKATVTAKTRALKAEYTMELAQDLKAIHGLDAETELANILSTEILAEINREVIRTINSQAKTGALQANTAVNGIFDVQTDADGRWSAEKFKGLILQIEREANVIAKETRRGKGNFVIVSSDVASALAASGMLDYSPALSTNLQVDDTGNTFAGVLNGRTKVYVDPYASADYVNVGYKGTNPYDAGLFYCPYVPLTMVRAVAEDSFQPRIGFKTRYGMASNPYVGTTPANGLAAVKTNSYYRIFRVDNILGA